MSAVFGGAGGTLIQKLSDMLFKGFNKLFESGLEIDEIKTEKDDEQRDIMTCTIRTGGDKILKVKMTRLKDDRWDMIVQGEDGHKASRENIRPNEADDIVTELIDKWYGESYEGVDDDEDLFEDDKKKSNVGESSKIRFGLKSVTSANKRHLKLTSVECSINNYRDAASALSSLMSDEEFVDAVPEDETFYEVDATPDELEVTELTEYDGPIYNGCDCNCFVIIMSACYDTLCDMTTLKWNSTCCAKNSMLLEQDWTLRAMMDALAGLCVETYGCAPDMKLLHSDRDQLDTHNGFSEEECYDIVSQDIQNIIDALQLFYQNVPSDIQFLFDQWTRDLKSYKNNTLARHL